MLENLFYRESSGWLAMDQYVGELRHRHQGCLHNRHCRAPQRLRSWRMCSTMKPTGIKTSRWLYALKLVLNFGGTLNMGRWLRVVPAVEMALGTEMTHGATTGQALSPKPRTMRTMRRTPWKGRRLERKTSSRSARALHGSPRSSERGVATRSDGGRSVVARAPGVRIPQ